ncbi:MAG: outer membrane lipoprotein carrier protein LolA [Planctomycetes bacterium]|nr:outer membrane lipoprotein carrier protein LolA [Planctomycetota bacterium]
MAALAAWASAAEPAGDPALLERIAAAHRSVATMSARFEQRTTNAAAPDEAPRVMQGHFEMAVPDRYNLVLTKTNDPDWRQRFVCDGKRSAEIEQVAADMDASVKVRDAAAGDADIRRIISCARGDFPELAKDFAIRALPAEVPADGAVVILVPANAEVAKELDRVRIELGADLRVRTLTLEQPSGTRIGISVTAATYDAPIAPETFAIPERD